VVSKSALGRVALVVAAVVLLASCAAGPNDAVQAGESGLAGFWLGLWHGVISPVTFIISLFNGDVSIYEVNNNGNWYDFGFMLGIFVIFSGAGGSGAAARPSRQGK
jgi:hypothetical protein